ncbi:MAG: peptide ABC transporter substrate-binding protein [Simkania sp.]|nr:peptide ABC transporter substrate-binding protein [Simkania sp.]
MKRILPLLLIIACLGITGCGRKKEPLLEASRGLEIGFKENVTSLDPRLGLTRPSNIVIRMLFEGLMRVSEQGQLVPGLAERYEVSEDRLTYTFYIRSCHWSNGDPVTAHDFEFAWKRSIEPSSAQSGCSVFYPIKNVSRCVEGKAKIEEVGIKALTDRILVVELEHPAPYFLELTTTTFFSPVPRRVVQENKDWANGIDGNFVSSGPFRLRSWKRGSQMKLDRNPFYWNTDNVHISDISIKILPYEYDYLQLYEQHKLDWVGQPLTTISSEVIEKLQHVEHQTSVGLLAYFCNVDSYPLNNKHLRKALAYGINRKTIADYIFYAGGTPAQSLLNPLLREGDKEVYFQDNDAAKAALYLRIALNELGTDLGDLPEIVLSYPNTQLQSRVAHEIQKQWKQNLGIVVKLDPMDKPRFFDMVLKGEHQIASTMWKGILLNPIHLLETMGSTLGTNVLTYWEDPEFAKLIEQIRCETNPQKAQKLIGTAEAYLIEEMPIIPICFGSVCFSKNEHLKNVYVSPLFNVDFSQAYFLEEEQMRRVR